MTKANNNKRAVVLLSGGLDSATVLALAKADGYECHALSIDYGQRHRSELDAARQLGRATAVVDHLVVKVDLAAIGGSALTEEGIDVPESSSSEQAPTGRGSSEIPVTYVPARNTVLLSVALGYAETLQAADIFIGANAVDYSGYPDCRPEFIRAFEQLANLATRAAVEGLKLNVHAPLIDMSIAEIIATGTRLGVDYARTISCYQATAEGLACGRCDSCRLRKQGFVEAGITDPTRYQ